MTDADSAPLDELKQQLDQACRVIDDPELMESYRQDQTIVPGGMPLAVVLPQTVDDVVTVMRWASRHRIAVVPRGSGTSLAGGASAVRGGVVLCTSRMTAVRELSPGNRYAIVEAGVITADVDRAARQHGLMYAPDPSSFEISTIGGNAATNAGGLRCVKYGVTRESVLGLEVVLADGRLLNTGGQTVKDVAGYDLTSLFVGSEGTLGIITAVTVRLQPLPPRDAITIAAGFPTLEQAGAAVAAIVDARLQPSLLELMDRYTLRAIDAMNPMGLSDSQAMLIAQADSVDAETVATAIATMCEAHGAEDVIISTSAAEAQQLLDIRRMAYRAAESQGTCLVEDVGVPVSKLSVLIGQIDAIADRHEVSIMTVAHAGDGNLHPTFVFDPTGDDEIPTAVRAAAADVFKAAVALGGTISGEHGIGVLKRDWLEHQIGEVAMDVSQAIRRAIDPLGILNPGKLLPPLFGQAAER